jgi:hypothetical protein
MTVQSPERTRSDDVSTAVEETGRDVGAVMADARDTVMSAASRVPEIADSTRAAVDGALRQMETGSDEALTAGASLALGAALGMLVGGAPRLFIVMALVPVAAIGAILLDRQTRTRSARSSGAKA